MTGASGSPLSVLEPTPRPRRLVRWLAGAVAVLLVLAVIAACGIAWYFSGVALAVDHSVQYGVTVVAAPTDRSAADPGTDPGADPKADPKADPGAGTGTGTGTTAGTGAGTRATAGTTAGTTAGVTAVRLTRDADTAQPGTLGLAWPGGYGRLGPVLSSDGSSVTRMFTPGVGGRPAPGTRVRVDSFVYQGDPSSALGLTYEDVRVPGPLGPLPSWFVPGPAAGARRTWVVFVHGHDSNRRESLRYLAAWHALGLPVLVPTYRDDEGAPSSPDGRHHLGDTEWQDVAAAVRWAHDHGADDVVLAGWSMGGAIALQVVVRSDVAALVRGVVLDSPVLDWRDVFAAQGADRGLPGVEVTLAEWAIQWRSGIDLDRLDWTAQSGELKRPVLIFHGDGDRYVPDGPAIRLAASRPDLVTLVRVPGARHVMSWNVDPQRYDATMREWLTRLLSTS